MAGMKRDSCQQIANVAKAENIPRAYLSQIFKQLVEGKILRSIKGPGGGYVFARPPQSITYYDIKLCIDGPDDFDKCVVGLDLCTDQVVCPAHESWKKLKAQARAVMCSTTLAKASEGVKKKQAQLISPMGR